MDNGDPPDKSIVGEFNRLKSLIDMTPNESMDVIRSYHGHIIVDLDSEQVIPIGSCEHRMLHQILWKKTYEIVNNCPDSNSAGLCFILGFGCGKSGECLQGEYLERFSTERSRFDAFYVKQYGAYLEACGDVGLTVIRDARKTVETELECSLEEAVVTI